MKIWIVLILIIVCTVSSEPAFENKLWKITHKNCNVILWFIYKYSHADVQVQADWGRFHCQCRTESKNGCESVLSNFLTWQGLFKLLITELKASLRKLEHENADLKFLNNQYVHKVKQLEKESKQKSDRILQLQEKNFQAVVQTPGEDTEF